MTQEQIKAEKRYAAKKIAGRVAANTALALTTGHIIVGGKSYNDYKNEYRNKQISGNKKKNENKYAKNKKGKR